MRFCVWSLTVMLLLTLMGCAQTGSRQQVISQDGFHSTHIKLVANAMPFESYSEWFTEVRSRNRNNRGLDQFQRTIDPRLYNRLTSNVEAHWIEYQSDGLKISGAMLWPKNAVGGKLPVVIYNRGGNSQMGQLSRFKLLNLLMPIAEQGYIVLASNYRGAKFSEGKDEFGGDDLNDVTKLLDLVSTIPNADTQRIAMMGWSRGAMMTLMALRRTDQIKAAVVVAGNVDQFQAVKRRPNMEKNVMAKLVPGFVKDRDEELKKRSAIFWLDELKADMPMLIMHGTQDWRVDYRQSQWLAEKLAELDRPHELHLFEDGDHSLAFFKHEWQSTLFDFLNETL